MTPLAGPSVAWLLVAVLLSLVVALCAALLRTREEAETSTILASAAHAFGQSMTMCVPVLLAMELL